MKKFETDLASLIKRGDQLATKRAAVQKELDTATEARQQALLAGDIDHALENHQRAVDSATSALQGLDDALSLIAREKTEAERQLAAERDRTARAEAFEKITTAINAIERRTDPLLSTMREVADGLMKLDHVSFESGQLGRHIAHAAGDVELAFAFVISDARRQMQAVKDGSAPIPRRPATVATNVVDQPAPTRTIFMLKSARYRDEETGRKRFLGQWEDATVPQEVALRALKLNVAVPTNDPRRAALRGTRNGDYAPNAADVVDLDAAEAATVPASVDPVLAQAGFTKIDRSADDRVMTISVPRS